MSNTSVARVVRWVRSQFRGVHAHILIWTIIACSATICLLRGMQKTNKHETVNTPTENVPEGLSEHREKSGEKHATGKKGEEEGEVVEEEVSSSEDQEKDTFGDDEEDEKEER